MLGVRNDQLLINLQLASEVEVLNEPFIDEQTKEIHKSRETQANYFSEVNVSLTGMAFAPHFFLGF